MLQSPLFVNGHQLKSHAAEKPSAAKTAWLPRCASAGMVYLSIKPRKNRPLIGHVTAKFKAGVHAVERVRL